MSATLVRDAVLGFVVRYPGVHPRAIERELGLSDRLAAHHLEGLVAEGHVERFDEGGFARYVARQRARTLTMHERRMLALVRRPPALRIMLLLATGGELPQKEIAQRLRLAKASTTYHLQALAKAKVVDGRDEGRMRFYSLREPERTIPMLEEFGALPGDLDSFSSMWDDLFR